MSTEYSFDAEIRTDLGKGASRRLRHAGKVPAILYGGDEAPVSLTLDHDKVNNAADHEIFYSSIHTLNVGGKKVQAILKDMQRHPFKPKLVHLDYQRVSAKEEFTTRVPVHFMNEEVIQKLKGVVIRHEVDIEVSCLPKDLPDAIEIDLAELEIGANIHLSEVTLPEGVTAVELGRGEDHDLVIVSITAAKEESTEDEESDTDSAAEAADDAADE
ncbi:50S ribosomal protein L25 [Aliidiomarina taiwanensis]|uniref:Large ribosomal subunit protein bL25 n=1 Tax=Aliidiomarina taiwanensis TaxID=946228 RepID=A0A432X964_9GAMM|nr:50S ribosomal protein L25/general stress protein Ctc [Aliidiomarina taiwanensis]RUO43899.1 50S ribosomal protein L25 [Aliidiomarina taiwanensis]